ncbi:MAG: hypothetical protein ABMA14_20945 [Hyphomonadaceae bacterium]
MVESIARLRELFERPVQPPAFSKVTKTRSLDQGSYSDGRQRMGLKLMHQRTKYAQRGLEILFTYLAEKLIAERGRGLVDIGKYIPTLRRYGDDLRPAIVRRMAARNKSLMFQCVEQPNKRRTLDSKPVGQSGLDDAFRGVRDHVERGPSSVSLADLFGALCKTRAPEACAEYNLERHRELNFVSVIA